MINGLALDGSFEANCSLTMLSQLSAESIAVAAFN
jgi:hypothetical protein